MMTLDLNGHVNNTVYITWAMEALDYEFRSKHKLKTLDIYFKHEVKIWRRYFITCKNL